MVWQSCPTAGGGLLGFLFLFIFFSEARAIENLGAFIHSVIGVSLFIGTIQLLCCYCLVRIKQSSSTVRGCMGSLQLNF
jgi:hypothetical protein